VVYQIVLCPRSHNVTGYWWPYVLWPNARRVTKETWKAREAREARQARVGLEAKRYQTSSDPHRKTQTFSVGPGCARVKVDHWMAHIEDVFAGEDGSIQCVVTMKPSLIPT
jgi:hypothetical protein